MKRSRPGLRTRTTWPRIGCIVRSSTRALAPSPVQLTTTRASTSSSEERVRRSTLPPAAADVGHGAGPPGVGDPLAPDLHTLAHEDATLGNAGQPLEGLVGPAAPGEHAVFGVSLVRVPDSSSNARRRGLRQPGGHYQI